MEHDHLPDCKMGMTSGVTCASSLLVASVMTLHDLDTTNMHTVATETGLVKIVEIRYNAMSVVLRCQGEPFGQPNAAPTMTTCVGNVDNSNNEGMRQLFTIYVAIRIPNNITSTATSRTSSHGMVAGVIDISLS